MSRRKQEIDADVYGTTLSFLETRAELYRNFSSVEDENEKRRMMFEEMQDSCQAILDNFKSVFRPKKRSRRSVPREMPEKGAYAGEKSD